MVTTWFEEQSKDFFSQGDKVVATKVGEVIELLGDYIKKNIYIYIYFL